MPIPTYDQFIEPLLRYLGEHPDGVRSSEVYGALAERVGLTDDERQARLPSRQQPVHHNRIGWAHDRLKRAGLSGAIKRGVWCLTKEGRDFLAAHPDPLSLDQVTELAKVSRDSRLREPTDETDALAAPVVGATPEATQSPDERIEEALSELNDSVASELLDLIGESSPAFFENLVLDLLHTMGYGTSRKALQRVGSSGDGGIDGVITLDKLGLEKVCVQAKRWDGTVGRPEIQATFYGALAGRRARKGVKPPSSPIACPTASSSSMAPASPSS